MTVFQMCSVEDPVDFSLNLPALGILHRKGERIPAFNKRQRRILRKRISEAVYDVDNIKNAQSYCEGYCILWLAESQGMTALGLKEALERVWIQDPEESLEVHRWAKSQLGDSSLLPHHCCTQKRLLHSIFGAC